MAERLKRSQRPVSEMRRMGRRVASVGSAGPAELAAVGNDVSDDMPKKRQKKTNAQVKDHIATCACCGNLSTDRIWKETRKTSSGVVPCGDKCEGCFDVWDSGFSWLPWPDFVVRSKVSLT